MNANETGFDRSPHGAFAPYRPRCSTGILYQLAKYHLATQNSAAHDEQAINIVTIAMTIALYNR